MTQYDTAFTDNRKLDACRKKKNNKITANASPLDGHNNED